MRFGPIDGNQENTALENWFPISAQELEQQREQIRLLRETNKAAQIKRSSAESELAVEHQQLIALRAENARLREVLIPLVHIYGDFAIGKPYELPMDHPIAIARAALSAQGGNVGPKEGGE